jgi:Leucine-rich repeat (LRR) protein
VEKVDLSNISKFSFIGSEKDKKNTSAIYFSGSSNIVKFFPVEIFEEFPAINGLILTDSNLPEIKTSMFTKIFKKIVYINFSWNKIGDIESGSFSELTNLKWLRLSYNQLKYLKNEIFAQNTKLEYIDLYENQIEILNPKLFDGLVKLVYVEMRNNDCANNWIGCNECPITTAQLSEDLSECFENCLNDEECTEIATATELGEGDVTTENQESKCLTHGELNEFSENIIENLSLKFSEDLKKQTVEIETLKEETKNLKLMLEEINGKLDNFMNALAQKFKCNEVVEAS